MYHFEVLRNGMGLWEVPGLIPKIDKKEKKKNIYIYIKRISEITN